MSHNNPFRTPKVTPNPTGIPEPAVSSSSPPALPPRSPSSTAMTSYAPPPGPPPGHIVSHIEEPDHEVEAPPAYTPSADVFQGESTVQFGPRRPFQSVSRPQHPPPQHHLSPNQILPQHTNGWSAYPGTPQQNTSQVPPLPPRPSNTSPVSDFARDFYAAGADVSRIAPTEQASESSSSTQRYAPPPGPPPPARPNNIPDDGRPTRTPMPGHPLLRHDKMLVYPTGYECTRCHNTGYKNFDPSHPCSKCWDKYAKPYAGPLAYAPTGSSSTPSRTSQSNTYQRPLPSFRPPQSSLSRSQSQMPISRPIPTYPSGPSSAYAQSPVPPQGPVHIRAVSQGHAPQGATVVHPGDPRIGGTLCWNCSGRGQVSLFIFDEITCPVCGGVGRVFR